MAWVISSTTETKYCIGFTAMLFSHLQNILGCCSFGSVMYLKRKELKLCALNKDWLLDISYTHKQIHSE